MKDILGSKSTKKIKKLKEIAQDGLYSAPQKLEEEQKNAVCEKFGISLDELTTAHVILYNQMLLAQKGDRDAIAYITLIAGEKPSEKLVVEQINTDVVNAVEQLVSGFSSPYALEQNKPIEATYTEVKDGDVKDDTK